MGDNLGSGSGKDVTTQGRGSDSSLPDDPGRRPGRGGGIGRQGFGDDAGGFAALAEARADRFFDSRVHRGTGQIPELDRTDGRVPEGSGYRLDLFPGRALDAAT